MEPVLLTDKLASMHLHTFQLINSFPKSILTFIVARVLIVAVKFFQRYLSQISDFYTEKVYCKLIEGKKADPFLYFFCLKHVYLLQKITIQCYGNNRYVIIRYMNLIKLTHIAEKVH